MNLVLVTFLIRSLLIVGACELMLLVTARKSAAVRRLVAVSGLFAVLILAGYSLLPAEETHAVFTTTVHTVLSSSGSLPPSALLHPQPMTEAMHLGEVGFNVWLGVTVLLLIRLALCLVLLGDRVNRTKPLGDNPRLRLDETASIPGTAWWGTHYILLPPSNREWPAERLETVLLHERAHIQRLDWWWNVLGQIACAIAWPNLLVWLLQFQSRELSEQAVDDVVLRSGVTPSRYAKDLLQIAVDKFSGLGSLSLPMATKPRVSRRIEMVLSKRNRGAASVPTVVATVGVQLGLIGALAGWGLVEKAPDLVHRGLIPSRPRLSQTVITAKCYLVDAQVEDELDRQGKVPTALMAAPGELERLLKSRHGNLVASKSMPLQDGGSKFRNTSSVDPKTVLFKFKPTSNPYTESLASETGMLVFKLDVGERRAHAVYVTTVSEGGTNTDWLAKETRPILLVGPLDGSKQLLFVHTFETRPAH